MPKTVKAKKALTTGQLGAGVHHHSVAAGVAEPSLAAFAA